MTKYTCPFFKRSCTQTKHTCVQCDDSFEEGWCTGIKHHGCVYMRDGSLPPNAAVLRFCSKKCGKAYAISMAADQEFDQKSCVYLDNCFYNPDNYFSDPEDNDPANRKQIRVFHKEVFAMKVAGAAARVGRWRLA